MREAYAQVGVEDFFRLYMSGPSAKSLEQAFRGTNFADLDDILDLNGTYQMGNDAPMCALLVGMSAS